MTRLCDRATLFAPRMTSVYRFNRGDCPRCRSTLNPFEERGARGLRCATCEGSFFTNEMMQLLYAPLLPFVHATMSAVPIEPLHCPSCQRAMRRVAVEGGGMLVDFCNAHGVWFDAIELNRLLDLATRPGLS
jgi:Zn-finger nucleic acid-binding protein